MTINQTFESIQAALADLQRSGVSDVACDDVFNFSTSKLPEPKHLTFNVTQKTEINRQSQTQNIVKNAAASLDAQKVSQKPKTPLFAVDDYVWAQGDAHDVLILISTPFSKGEEPLSDASSHLFERMLSAIGLSSHQVSWLVIKDEDATGKPHKSAHALQMKERAEVLLAESSSRCVLMVGQSCGKIMFGENLSALRKKEISLAQKSAVALCHPNMLLKQPALKRMAWQDLLRFKEECA